MKLSTFLMLFSTLIWISSCAENRISPERAISTESEKYFLNTDLTIQRIRELKANSLNDGQCFADPETKIYLTNIKASAVGNYRELKSQINVSKLENTASSEYYFCRVTCLLNDRYAAFWTTLTDSPSRHSDDNAFICQGISMEMVNIPGTSLSTLGPVVKLISAFDLGEVLPRLKEINYKMSTSTKEKLDQKAYTGLAQISEAYINSTMPALIEAGKILDQIAYQKAGSRALLDKYVAMINNNNGKLKADYSTDYFVMLNIIQNGRHFLYEKM